MVRVSLCLVGLWLLGSVAVAQDLQRGTKQSPEAVVAYVAGQSPLPTLRADLERVFPELWAACHAGGLHPLGLPTFSFDATGIDTGTMNWEARLPLADSLDLNNLPDTPQLHVKRIVQTSVAYAYLAGDPWEIMGTAFGDLHKWAVNQNLPATWMVRAIVYVGPFGKTGQDIITECQVELRQTGGQ